MSYQVLARKWRPRAFTEMVGQEHVLRALINGLDNDRLHHAYLFTGTRGVGKTTIARILAKCLNCEQGVSSIPCNECSACREIAEGRFVDLIEVDAASRTKVEDTRELLDNVQYAPSRGRYKVYLIDEVHMLSSHSFNALLKTLEEPPPHVKFLLATTDPQKLPVTILSRCLQFNLKNLPPERIVGHLQHVLGQEKIPFEESALWDLGRSADGSMRDALSLTDQAIAHGGGALTAAEVTAMLGTIDRSAVVDICRAVASGESQEVMACVARLAEHAPDYSAALADMLTFWHQVAIAQSVPDALDPVQEHHGTILELAAQVSREDVQLFYQMTLLGRKDLPFAADPRSGFEMALLRLLVFRPVMPETGDPPPPGAGAANTAKKPEPVQPQSAGPSAKAQPSSAVEQSPPSNAGSPATATRETEPAALSVQSPPRQTSGDSVERPPVEKTQSVSRKEDAADPEADEYCAAAEYESYSSSCVIEVPEQVDAPASVSRESKDASRPQTVAVEEAASVLGLEELCADSWVDVCQGLGLGGLLMNTASNLVLESVDGDCLRFHLDADNSALYDEGQQERLAAALSGYFKRTLTVEIQIAQIGVETPRMIAARKKAERLQQAVDSLRADPRVQELCRVFGGELIESTVKPID